MPAGSNFRGTHIKLNSKDKQKEDEIHLLDLLSFECF